VLLWATACLRPDWRRPGQCKLSLTHLWLLPTPLANLKISIPGFFSLPHSTLRLLVSSMKSSPVPGLHIGESLESGKSNAVRQCQLDSKKKEQQVQPARHGGHASLDGETIWSVGRASWTSTYDYGMHISDLTLLVRVRGDSLQPLSRMSLLEVIHLPPICSIALDTSLHCSYLPYRHGPLPCGRSKIPDQ
jgi:hypothetical protein